MLTALTAAARPLRVQDAFDKQAEELSEMLAESRRWLADVEAAEASRYSCYPPSLGRGDCQKGGAGRGGAGRVHWSRARAHARSRARALARACAKEAHASVTATPLTTPAAAISVEHAVAGK